MPIDHKTLDDLKPLSSKTFDEIKQLHFKPDPTMTGLKLLRDKAKNEKNLRELYRGRALYELLQNADDCGASTACFFLTPEGMAFGHDGEWFTVRNFINLADGWSDKDPKQCIGHKGLGFRSVLDITPSPHLVKVSSEDFLAVKFSWALNNNFIQSAIRENNKLDHDNREWTKHGERICPVMYIPNVVKKSSIGYSSRILDNLLRGEYRRELTTLFWFPSEDDSISPGVLKEIDPATITSDLDGKNRLTRFLIDEVSTILPFLRSIENVTVFDGDEILGLVKLDARIKENEFGIVHLTVTVSSQKIESQFYQLRRTVRIPLEVKKAQGTPKAVNRMDSVGLTLSVRINQGKPVPDNDAFFHVYFPTKGRIDLGFIVHSDFYVSPDRNRLMEGDYNDWLLDEASKTAANDFLTVLLDSYQPSDVFASILPRKQVFESGSFATRFATHMKARKTPFLPVSSGLTTRERVLIPPRIDRTGFWKSHFPLVAQHENGFREFLKPSEDSETTRAFLNFVSIFAMQPSSLLDYIEKFGKGQSAPWWFECLSALATDPYFATKESTDFHNHRLLMLLDGQVSPCQKEDGRIICLPPREKDRLLDVPSLLSKHLGFVHPDLATLITSGRESVREWIKRCLGISNFEASELLPKVSAKIALEVFASQQNLVIDELVGIWTFMLKMLDPSTRRQMQGERFWENIGRLPVIIDGPQEQTTIAPAFLTYLPDQLLQENSPIRGVSSFRRVDMAFLDAISAKSSSTTEDCVSFFEQAGVSDRLKARQFAYVVVRDPELQLHDPSTWGDSVSFTGERQRDENRVVLEIARRHGLWTHYLDKIIPCSHGSIMFLRKLSVLEGFEDCVIQAIQNDANAGLALDARLLQLAATVAAVMGQHFDGNKAFCRSGGGHEVTLPSLIEQQIKRIPWIPTTIGVFKIDESFSRLRSRRLISSGGGTTELGDKILPYVVLDEVERQFELQTLGVQPLEDPENAASDDLIRALKIIALKLSDQLGRDNILQNKSAWRLVRGAIQEIYRQLNQRAFEPSNPRLVSLACRKPEKTIFASGKIYFADPGSAIERALAERVNLLDADRPYVSFFSQMGITRLQVGSTVKESVNVEGHCIDEHQLRENIVQNLAPYLLALVIAKSETPKQAELATRRLLERFSVKVVGGLNVVYSLVEDASIQEKVPIPRFYLQTQVTPGVGAIEEKSFSLYTVGDEGLSLFGLDADDLGQQLAPIFVEDNEQIAGLFPRVAARYLQAKGNSVEMEEFMLRQLGVSAESLDLAKALISGEALDHTKERFVPSMTWVPTPTIDSNPEESKRKLLEILEQQKKELLQQIQEALDETIGGGNNEPTPPGGEKGVTGIITPKQEERGTRGEEEIKRRMTSTPTGWEGFTLLKDRRKDRCGYDFLCSFEGAEVEIEIKTFTLNGRIFFDEKELKTASSSGDRYFLIGVVDSEKPSYTWQTYTVRNPFELLFLKGRFLTDIKLQVSPAELFGPGVGG